MVTVNSVQTVTVNIFQTVTLKQPVRLSTHTPPAQLIWRRKPDLQFCKNYYTSKMNKFLLAFEFISTLLHVSSVVRRQSLGEMREVQAPFKFEHKKVYGY